ncbi:MAG: ABC transporter substrate-binding protein [Ruminococcus sp.]|nr:ABC transporter substrate-binding protein [Ruminococcus sp.]
MGLKRVLSVLSACVLAVGIMAGCGKSDDESSTATEEAKNYKIGIVQIMEHTSLNTIRDAVVAQLEELGYKDGENCTIDLQQANNEATMVTQILDKFKADGDDIIVAITTPCATAAAAYSDEIPVVFSAVTDPVSAGLVQDWENSGDENLTGTSDKLDITKILDTALTITPDIKTLGYLYNTGESNSVSCLEEVKEYCDENGIELVEASATTATELAEAATTLFSKCDAVFSPNDNTVAGAMGTVAQVAIDAGKPMYVGADSMVQDGGFATVGIEYTDLGIETANMVDQILQGEQAGDIPVKVFNEDLSTYINKSTAEAIGVTIPEDIENGEKTVFFE